MHCYDFWDGALLEENTGNVNPVYTQRTGWRRVADEESPTVIALAGHSGLRGKPLTLRAVWLSVRGGAGDINHPWLTIIIHNRWDHEGPLYPVYKCVKPLAEPLSSGPYAAAAYPVVFLFLSLLYVIEMRGDRPGMSVTTLLALRLKTQQHRCP